MKTSRLISPPLGWCLSAAAGVAGALITTGAHADPPHPEVSARELAPDQYEFTLNAPTLMTEAQAMAIIADAAKSVCKTPTLGRYRFEATEQVGSAKSKKPRTNTFRFVQEVSCAGSPAQLPSMGTPTLDNEDDARLAGEEARRQSERYFQLIAAGDLDPALGLVAVDRMGISPGSWRREKEEFRHRSAAPVRIEIRKITIYDNPQDAPEPGLYVAADYVNAFADMPVHCGYLMWFRPPGGGELRLTREESGYITAAQMKDIPSESLPEIRRKLRCVD